MFVGIIGFEPILRDPKSLVLTITLYSISLLKKPLLLSQVGEADSKINQVNIGIQIFVLTIIINTL